MVIYFTGTGNSRYLAKRLAAELKDDVVDIFSLNNKCGTFESEKPFVFVAPTHAYKIPPLFERFIKDSVFSGSKKAYFIMTCGDTIGDAKFHLARLCKSEGFEFMGVRACIMPENYICMFDSPPVEEAKK